MLFKEYEPQPNDLGAEIEATYQHVFGSEAQFTNYFFATRDEDPRDLQVRLGIFIKRLLTVPSERFWFMRARYRNSRLSKVSLHRIDEGSSRHIALNGYMEAQIEVWREQQPSQRMLFLQMVETLLRAKLQLPIPKSDDSKILYQEATFELSNEAVLEVLQLVLPEGASVDSRNYFKDDRLFEVDTPQVSFAIKVVRHEVFGDYIKVDFSRDAVKIDEEMMAEYELYYQTEVIPVLVHNAITALEPRKVREAIENLAKHTSIFKRMFLTPNVLDDQDKSRKYSAQQYYAWGWGLDLDCAYAQKLGLLPEDSRRSEHLFLGGWFTSVEQVWHSLFNVEYPGETVISSIDTVTNAIQVKSDQMSPTHVMVLEKTEVGESRYKDFLKTAQTVLNGYRFFTQEDFAQFTFPEGYQPIAVSVEGDFAIGVKEMNDGVELCFQVNDGSVRGQIHNLIRDNEAQIRRLKIQNDRLGEEAQPYFDKLFPQKAEDNE